MHSGFLMNLVLILSSVSVIYILVSIIVTNETSTKPPHFSLTTKLETSSPTSLDHIVFGIASDQNSWMKRKEYVGLWWRPYRMRGCVFLESMPLLNSSSSGKETYALPPLCISGDTSRFRYTYRGGPRWAIRVARVVSETVALNYSNVRWFVFGDDDTVFFPDNLVKTLSKYDHELWYYVGANSEMYMQNMLFSFDMAFGGAGFAISYPLARVLAKALDPCLETYPHLYGGDERIFSCTAGLGIGLTKEPGFHQMDIQGNVFGLLTAHPLMPLVSLHNLEAMDPIFPNMTTTKSLNHLIEAAKVDPHRILQQTVCYDRWFSWTISVSWGYAVQVYSHNVFLLDALQPEETFKPWKEGNDLNRLFSISTRAQHPNPCHRPTVFFLDEVSSGRKGIQSSYKRTAPDNCTFDMASPRKLEEIRVFSNKLELDIQKLRAPRRHCCDVLPSSAVKVLDISIRECKVAELIYMHA